MATGQHNVNNQPPPNYAGFGADGDTFATQDQQAGPSGFAAAGGFLFTAALLVFAVLDGIGVW